MDSRQQSRRRVPLAVSLCALLLLGSGCRSMQFPATDAAGNPIYLPAQSPGMLAPGMLGGTIVGEPVCPPCPPEICNPCDPCNPCVPQVVAPLAVQAPPPITYEGLVLRPTRIVSPVGSEVILVATVYNRSGQPRANQRVEWMLSPESVGNFFEVGDRGNYFALRHLHDVPKKIDNRYMIGSTRARTKKLTRGTPQPNDDLAIGRGQAWVSLSSATEGTSHITAFAPKVVSGFERQRQSTTVYWIDAQFQFPAPAVTAVGGRHTFNTVVLRQTNGTPLAGWLVRYEVIDGSGAVFGPNGATSVEVATGPDGTAPVEVFQVNPQRGTAQIQVQVLRVEADGERLAVGNGRTSITWTAPDINLNMTGPAEVSVGSVASYRIDVSNPGDLPVSDVVVTNRVPTGLTYQDSNPPANQSPSSLEWRIGSLGPREQRSINVNYRVTGGGQIENCAEVNTSEGLAASDCATAQGIAGGVEVSVNGPRTATVGDTVTYRITIANRGAAPATGLVIRDTYDSGLEHPQASPITRQLGTLAAGAVRDDVGVTFRVLRAGRHCHTVEVSGDSIRTTASQVCLTATPAAAPAPIPQPQPEPQPQPGPVEPGPVVPDPNGQPAGRPGLAVEKTGPTEAQVGDSIQFTTVITNTGETILRDVKLVDEYELGLVPTRAEPGHTFENDRLNWRIPELQPGESRRFRVQVRCSRAAASACSRAQVTTLRGLIRADDTCLPIRAGRPPAVVDPGPGTTPGPITPPVTPPVTPPDNGGGIGIEERGLIVTIVDLADEVAVGGTVTYVVRVQNNRNEADQNVVVVVDTPPGTTPLAVGILAPSRHSIVGQRLQFNPVATIRPGESLVYRFPVRGDRAGRIQVNVQVTSEQEREPITATEESSIFVGR